MVVDGRWATQKLRKDNDGQLLYNNGLQGMISGHRMHRMGDGGNMHLFQR
jgi:hypothetical protein